MFRKTWWTLTGHYGNIYPIDWTKSGMVGGGGDTKLFGGGIGEGESYSQACIDSGVVDDHRSDDNNTADGWKVQDDDVDDDAEDDDAMLLDDHVISADDVINELDELLDDANNSNTQRSLRSLHGKLHNRKNFVSRILATDHLRLTKKFPNNSVKDREANIADNPELLKLPLETLLRMRDEMNRSILDHSEVLIRELDIRDELEYEKELKNQFIWLLITVQKRRKELMSSLQLQQQQQQQLQPQQQQLSHNNNTNNNNNNNNCIVVDNNSTTNFNVNYNNNNNNNNSHQLIDDNNNNKSNVNNINNNNNTVTSTPANNNNSNNNNTTKLINTSNTTTTTTTTGVKQPAYLTTVIPYKKQQAPLSIDILLVFIRILSAINDNSPTTPSLLTDYILKILCPAA
ncbi:hypothetical protein HELRODRAFT_193301 [Helobdella robusta]|uniref:Uncharacterized protein n=1 Tax=Helobdella robusta TaxID=6412 RepID=T1FUV0_HELRO|nr:hypothetical protein HELRODRAFT_193301 [Helobdella robusta]ESN97207.1 hypothetical protein HELRODRAFT_193301 [Helobdella robusta]